MWTLVKIFADEALPGRMNSWKKLIHNQRFEGLDTFDLMNYIGRSALNMMLNHNSL